MTYHPEFISTRRHLTTDERKLVTFYFKYLASSESLSEREVEVLISIEDQFNHDGKLSDSQIDLIAKIFARH
jgi:hypothetical protein